MKKIGYSISVIYLLALFFLYPILVHILMYDLGYMTDKLPYGKFWGTLQVFVSGPIIIILGLILLIKYRRSMINQFFGVLLIGMGLYWIYRIIGSLMNEAA